MSTEKPRARWVPVSPQADARQGAACPAGAAHQVKRLADLGRDLRAAAYGMSVAAAFGEQIEAAELLVQGSDNPGARLVPVGRPVKVGQVHAMADRAGQRRVKRQVFLATDDTYR